MGHATCLACRTQQTGPAVHGDSGGGLPGVLHKALCTRESPPPPSQDAFLTGCRPACTRLTCFLAAAWAKDAGVASVPV